VRSIEAKAQRLEEFRCQIEDTDEYILARNASTYSRISSGNEAGNMMALLRLAPTVENLSIIGLQS